MNIKNNKVKLISQDNNQNIDKLVNWEYILNKLNLIEMAIFIWK